MPWWFGITAVCAVGIVIGGLMLLPRQPRPDTPQRVRAPGLRVTRWLSNELARAGWGELNVHTVLSLWALAALVGGLLVGVLIPIPALPPLTVLATGFLGRALLRSKIAGRERRLRRAWPGVVDHLRSAVRSGASVGEAVVLVAPRVSAELQPAFTAFHSELERGTRLDTALALLKQRVANPIADRIIEALRMAHDVGGRELPRVLEALQGSLRSDIAVREDAIAKQSWIRAASRLGVAAPWIVLVVLSGRTETIEAYQSVVGTIVILSGALLGAIAYKMMAALGRLPEDSRWFAQ